MPETKQLIAALIAAKKHFRPAVKGKENPHFKSKYADLAEVIDATQEALAESGLLVLQPTDVDEQGRTLLVTKLLHTSGEQEVGRYLLNPAKQDPQGYAAALTYARRHCYMAMIGIAPEDDDGNTASQPPKKVATRDARHGELLSAADRQVFLDLMVKHGKEWPKIAAWLSKADKSFPPDGKVTDVTYEQAGRVRKAMESQAAKAKPAVPEADQEEAYRAHEEHISGVRTKADSNVVWSEINRDKDSGLLSAELAKLLIDKLMDHNSKTWAKPVNGKQETGLLPAVK